MTRLKDLPIGKKLVAAGIGVSALLGIALFGLSLWQSRRGEALAAGEVRRLAKEGQQHVLAGVVAMVTSQKEVLEQKVAADLNVAREVLRQAGPVRFEGGAAVEWKAVNQLTRAHQQVRLPRMMAGGTWLGQNTDLSTPSPVVDRVKELVGGTTTIFQRMNEAGDMLRVSTNVETAEKKRAIGTYIPAINADGSRNAVLAKVLAGERFVGRAFVVNRWYVTAYEPIRVDGKVAGVLYVGVPEESAVSLRRQIMDVVVGETGYVYVLDPAGNYVISQRGQRDGESLWNAQDAEGNLFIQEAIRRAKALKPGEYGEIRYPWKNPGDHKPRFKTVTLAYYPPWQWIIAAGTWDEEFMRGETVVHEANAKARLIMIGVVLVLVSGAAAVWLFLARTITSPVAQCIDIANRVANGELEVAFGEATLDETGQLMASLRTMVGNLRTLIDDMNRMSRLHDAGDLDGAIPVEQHKGAFQAMGAGVNAMVAGHITLMKKAMDCVAEFGRGHFDAPLEAFPGKKAFINATIEELRQNLQEVSRTVGTLIEAAKAGQLDTRGEPRALQGDWASVVKGLNELLDAVVQPVNEVMRIMGQIEAGDLTARIPTAHQGDFQKLALAINNGTARLRDALAEISSATHTLASSSEELTATADAMASTAEQMTLQANSAAAGTEQASANVKSMALGVEEISVNAGTVASASEQVSANLRTVGAAVEEMSSNMDVIAGSTGQMTAAVRSVATAIEEMSASLGEVSQSSTQAATVASRAALSADHTAQIVERLGRSAQEIGNVVDLIKGIAAQTNLLALNATIEAASAGEAGRGFAVVATEVKELAKQTSGATEEIRAQVEEMQHSTQQAVQAIDEIVRVITEINEISGSIAASVEEQTATTRQIRENVGHAARGATEVSRNVQQAASGTTEVSRSVQEAVNGVADISRNIAQLAAGAVDVARNAAEAAMGMSEVSRGVSAVSTSAGETTRGAGDTRTAAKELALVAEKLRQSVSRFRLAR